MSQFGQGNSQWDGGKNPWADDGSNRPGGQPNSSGGSGNFGGGGGSNNTMPVWAIILIVLGVMFFIGCAGCCGFLAWFGSVTPDTWAYAGNEVPQAYLETAEEVGALEPGEEPTWFYSDAITDIREGFYLVTPSKVVVYKQMAATKLRVVPMDEIVSADLYRETSFFIDSTITLELEDGSVVTFPVSSDRDGDEAFFKVIKDNMAGEQ